MRSVRRKPPNSPVLGPHQSSTVVFKGVSSATARNATVHFASGVCLTGVRQLTSTRTWRSERNAFFGFCRTVRSLCSVRNLLKVAWTGSGVSPFRPWSVRRRRIGKIAHYLSFIGGLRMQSKLHYLAFFAATGPPGRLTHVGRRERRFVARVKGTGRSFGLQTGRGDAKSPLQITLAPSPPAGPPGRRPFPVPLGPCNAPNPTTG